MTDYVARARHIADEVLFPAAIAVDRAGAVPDSHFRMLAAEGFYGIAAPAEVGGADVELPMLLEVLEILAGGCLATMFVWVQHHGALRSLARSTNEELRERWLPGLVSGERRAGVAFAGAIPQPPKLWAKRVAGGYTLSGEAPFVSGWHSVDVIQVSARSADDDEVIISGIIETRAKDGPTADPVQLAAAQGSDTVRLTFNDVFLLDAVITGDVPRTDFLAGQVFSARINGSVPLGLAGRCVRLIEAAGRDELATQVAGQVTAVRDRLDAALAAGSWEEMAAARAAASELAYRAGGAAVVAVGSSGITVAHHAQRLAREGMFAMVAAGRPEIRTELLRLMGNGH